MDNQKALKLTASVWKLDEDVLSDQDKFVLKQIGFPKELKSGLVLIRRTQKRQYGKIGWIDKEMPQMTDIKYLTTSYNVAKYALAEMHAVNEEQKEKVEGIKNSRAFTNTYIDAEHIEDELTAILDAFSQPSPTPSMKKNISDTVVAEEIEAEDVSEATKKLSNKHKGIAKRMYKEESKDVEEIAKELGVDKERVLTYLKTL